LYTVGPDNIAGKIHKDNADIWSDILNIIYKKSMETGQISLDWNHANVAPVLLLNLFECFYHCFVLVGDQVILFVIRVTYSI
jgi:hypothetical protein